MLNEILKLVKEAEDEQNIDLISNIKEIINDFAETYNAPSNWRDIGEQLEKMYDSNSWAYENLELWNHKTD